MKRILYLALIFATTGAMAQNAKVVSAYNSMTSGNFEEAREYIDAAAEHEKTSDKEKTWRYRGQIYLGLAQSEESTIDIKKAIEESIRSYKKAMELDTKGSWADENRTNFDIAKAVALNSGIVAYNDQNYTKSRDMFLLAANAASDMGLFDTTAVYNGGLAAEQAGDYDTAIKLYRDAAEVGYLGPKMYLYIGNVYNKMEKPEEYLNVIKEGRQKYPDDTDLIVYELNYYLQNNKFEEAENNLKLAIEKEPNNKQLYFSLGVVYDNLGNTEKAVKAYEDAIAIDADYFDAAYNLGAMYFNQGVEMNNAANDIKDNKKYDAARAEAKKVFVKSKPYLEKAHQLDENDMGAMQSLSQLYALLNETEKYQAIKAKMETK